MVEPSDVTAIISTSIGTAAIRSHINTADVILKRSVDNHDIDRDIRDELLKWLAAHFCAIQDPRMVEDMAGGMRSVFEGKSGMGLDFTRYGQQAKLIDPTGELSKLSANRRARLNFKLSDDQVDLDY